MRKLLRNLMILSVVAQGSMLFGWWLLGKFLRELDTALPDEDLDWFHATFDDYDWDDFYDPA